MKTLWLIPAGILLLASCSPPVHVVLTVRDPQGLAGNAVAVDVALDGGPRRRVELGGAGFPTTVLMVGVSGGREGVVDVAAVDAVGVILAEARTAVRFPSSSTGTAAVDLGVSCASPDSTGSVCALPVLSGGVATQGVCRAGRCISPQCGDGVRNADLGEACDDGNQSGDDDCTPECTFNVCGDGWAHALDEECDDGNSDNEDGCLNTCLLNVCGDGFVFMGVEECDDANDIAGDGCLPTCVANACGDGVVEPGVEDCDDGNSNPNDACNACEPVVWVPRVVVAGNPSGIGAATALPQGDLVDVSQDPRGGVVIGTPDGLYVFDASMGLRRELSPGLFDLAPGFLTLGTLDGVLATADRLWVADAQNHRAYTLEREGGALALGAGAGRVGKPEDPFIQWAARQALIDSPAGFGTDSAGNVYVADTVNSMIWRIFGSQAEVYAGDTTACAGGLGAVAKQTSLCNPTDVAAAPDGTIYVADTGQDRILALEPSANPFLPAVASVYAGTGSGGAFDGTLSGPEGVTVAGDGTLYIADTGNHVVRAVDGTGMEIVLPVAGILATPGFSGDGATAGAAELDQPTAVALDELGVLYILDKGNQRLRTVDPLSSTIDSILTVDDAMFVSGRDASELSLEEPHGVATDGTSLFVSDRTRHRVYQVASDGTVTWLAGDGPTIGNRSDFDTETGVGTAMALDGPRGLSLDGTDLYVADTDNHRIRRIDLSNGMMSTVAGSGSAANGGNTGDTMQATVAQLDSPEGVLAVSGVIYIADTGNYSVRRVDAGGVIDTIAGTGVEGMSPATGAPTSTPLGEVVDVALAGNGDIYIADRSNATVWQLPTSGDIVPLIDTTDPVVAVAVRGTEVLYATNAGELYSHDGSTATLIGGGATLGTDVGDGALAVDALIGAPGQIAVSGVDVWVADSGVGRVRRIEGSSGVIASVAGLLHPGDGDFGVAGLPGATALIGDGADSIWAVDGQRLRQLDLSASRSRTLAGYPAGLSEANNAGGSAALARVFNEARGIAFDSATGTLYVSEYGNHAIHRVTSTATIEVFVGVVNMPGYVDGTGSAARLNSPTALFWDALGNRLLVADTLNHVVRAVDGTSGAVSTVAGTPGQRGFAGDGGDALSAFLNEPQGVAVDGAGMLWIADTLSHRIRRVDSAGVIDTVMGTGLASFPQAPGPALNLSLDSPRGLHVDAFGNLYVASRVGVVEISPGPSGLRANVLFEGTPSIGGANCLSSVYSRALDDGVWVADACSGAVIELQRMGN